MPTFGKWVWDGCAGHAEKEATSACGTHHVVLRDARSEKCQGRLTSQAEVTRRHCRRCAAINAA